MWCMHGACPITACPQSPAPCHRRCLEACYQQLKGVSKVVSGYAGGHVKNPTYEQVCGKQTGHAEVVQVRGTHGWCR
jgi:hypothetical protein